MLKKNIFKFVCLLLVIFTGCSFLLCKSEKASADINDVSTSNLASYVLSISDYSSKHTGSVTDDSGNVLDAYCQKDDYVFYTGFQNPYGLCWSYAANMVLTSTLMINTGQYYDFSEGWISAVFNYLSNNPDNNSNWAQLKTYINSYVVQLNNGNYYVGGGGIFMLNDYLSRMAGVVLESDFTYDEFQAVCSENVQEVYEAYSQYANEEIMENLVTVKFNNYTTSSYTSTKKTQIKNSIKNHIKTTGAVSAGMKWDSTSTTLYGGKNISYKVANSASDEGHAITLIGWDDNIVVNGVRGAWIALNSWGDDWGNEGVFYISYTDTDFKNFYAYDYSPSTSGTLDYANTASSDAVVETSLAGAYFGDFSTKTQATKQQNIFYQQNTAKEDYGITYSYNISSDVAQDDIDVKVYYYDTDSTEAFNINPNYADSTISISPIESLMNDDDLPAGTYKVIISYTNGTNVEEYLNCFYVMDGTEINYAQFNLSTSAGGSIKNNGFYALYNDYNLADKNLVFASSNTSGAIMITLYASAYSDVESITSSSGYVYARDDMTDETIGKYGFQIEFDLSQATHYPLTIQTTSGITRTVNVLILQATEQDSLINMVYHTNGGYNYEMANLKRMLVSSTTPITILEAIKPGYKFAGWYLDANFTSPLTSLYDESMDATYYTLTNSQVNIITSPTIEPTYQSFYDTYYNTCSYVHLFAKWEKIKVQYNVTFVFNNGEENLVSSVEEGEYLTKPDDPTKAGHKFEGWYTTPTFNSGTEFDFTNTQITSELTLYAKWKSIKPTYNITFVYNNGETNLVTSVEEDGYLTKPNDPTKEGHTFEGWYTTPTFDSGTEFDFANTQITSAFSLYAKWQINKYTINIYYSGNSTADLTYKNVEHGDTGVVAEPQVTKDGYTLVGWYTTSTFESGTNYTFGTPIVANTNIYAKWQLSDLQGIQINIPASIKIYEYFNITITFSHKLEFDVNDIKVIVYRLASTARTGAQLELTTQVAKEYNSSTFMWHYVITAQDSISEASTYTYAFTLKVADMEGVSSVTSSEIQKTIIANEQEVGIENIVCLKNKTITWEDTAGSQGTVDYKLSLFKDGQQSAIAEYSTGNTSWNVEECIKNNGGGKYRVEIQKTLNGNIIGTATKEFVVYVVSFVTYINSGVTYNDLYIPSGYAVGELARPSVYQEQYKAGYNFINWYKAGTFADDEVWSDDNMKYTTITSNLTLYAKWEITAGITFGEIQNIDTTYQKNVTQSVIVTPSHDIMGTFTYKWFKLEGKNATLLENVSTPILTAVYVKDSGTYYCEVTLTDDDGFTKTTKTENIVVNIAKATTYVNLNAIYYTRYNYTGIKQVVSGASISRDEETTHIDENGQQVSVLSYEGNEFVDVPIMQEQDYEQATEADFTTEYGTLYVKIIVAETENYQAYEQIVPVKVYKIQGEITASGIQNYTYTSKPIMPQFSLNNTEQTNVTINQTIINVGEYDGVIITAKASRNYKSASTAVTVIVNRAKIQIKAKDIYSLWLFDLNELQYEIYGEYNGEDLNIQLVCSADKYSAGQYKIAVNFENNNYEITLEDGTYNVTAVPYYALLALIALIMLISFIIRMNKQYLIDFEENGGDYVPAIETKKKKEIVLKEPVRHGYKFMGWYADKKLTKPFANNVKRGKLKMLYAKWQKLTEEELNAKEISPVDRILMDLNIKKPEVTQMPKQEVAEESTQVVIRPIPEAKPQKTKQDILNDIIKSASQNVKTKPEQENIQGVLSEFNIKIKPKTQAETVAQPVKSQSEMINDLIKKASQTKPTTNADDIEDIINKITKKD